MKAIRPTPYTVKVHFLLKEKELKDFELIMNVFWQVRGLARYRREVDIEVPMWQDISQSSKLVYGNYLQYDYWWRFKNEINPNKRRREVTEPYGNNKKV